MTDEIRNPNEVDPVTPIDRLYSDWSDPVIPETEDMMFKLYDTLNGCFIEGQEYASVADFFKANPVEDLSSAELENWTLVNEEEDYDKSLEDAYNDSFK